MSEEFVGFCTGSRLVTQHELASCVPEVGDGGVVTDRVLGLFRE